MRAIMKPPSVWKSPLVGTGKRGQAGEIPDLVDRHHAVDEERAVLAPHHRGAAGLARLGDVADQRLQDVVERDDALEIAVFVDHQRHRLAALLEDLERAQRRHGLRADKAAAAPRP